MKSKTRASVIVILILVGLFAPIKVRAIDDQTVHIAETGDDGFITEVGIGIDTSHVTMLDPGMDIRSYFIFENIEINPWELVTNATLRLTSAQTLPFDADSSVTVYGMKQSDLGGKLTDTTTLSPAEILSMPLTDAFTNVNTSQFQGGATIDINVTGIIKELISNPNWDGDGLGPALGDDLGFIILGAPDEQRNCYDYRGDPARSADLIIHWGATPPPPPGGGDYNQTYRDLNIWVIDNLGENRTGTPNNASSVNWALLNQTMLTEFDSGARVVRNNATWNTATSLRAQEVMSLYNDTGGLNINTFFVRFAINVTDLDNVGAGSAPVVGLAGISTLNPNAAAGHAYDNAPGEWVGIALQINVDDVRYRIYLRERQNLNTADTGFSQWFTSNTNQLLYIEFHMKHFGGDRYIQYRIYDDPAFTNLIEDETYTFISADEPFRYPQILASAGPILANDKYWGEFYTYLDSPVPVNETWIVTYQNGTIIGDCDSFECALVIADDFLGPDPEDPTPPSQGWDETGPFQRFNVRFYILALGMGLFWGPLFVFAYSRPSGYEFVIGAFIMLVGIAFLIAAGSV